MFSNITSCFKYMMHTLIFFFLCSHVAASETLKLVASESCPYVCDQKVGKGFLVDIVERIFEREGVPIEVNILPYKRAMHMVENGQADGIIGILQREGLGLVFPTESIGQYRYTLYVKKHDPWLYTGLNALYDRRIGIKGGVSYGALDAYINRYSNYESLLHILYGQNADGRLMKLLLSNRINLFLGDENMIRYQFGDSEDNVNMKVKAAGHLPSDNIYVAFKQGMAERFAQMVSQGMVDLRKQGLLAGILARYGVEDWLNWSPVHKDPFPSDYVEQMTQRYAPTRLEQVDTRSMVFEAAVRKGSGYWLYATKFQELLELYSKGSMRVRLRFGDSTEHDIAMNIAEGNTQMGMIATNNIAPYAPSLGVFSLPYLFPDIDSTKTLLRHEVMENIALRAALESNVRPLSFYIGGYRLLANNVREVRTTDELKGLKIRVPQNQIIVETFRSWGIETYPLPWPAVYPALESGYIHGQENPMSIMMFGLNMHQELWKSIQYVTQIKAILFTAPHLISEQFFKSLNMEQQQIIKKAAKDAEEYMWHYAAQNEADMIQLVKDKGVVFTSPQDEKSDWELKSKTIWPKLYFRVGGQQYVEKIQDIMLR